MQIPIALAAIAIDGDSPDYDIICEWPYVDEFVRRILLNDLRIRMKFGRGQLWVYRDPDGQMVGFGSLDVNDDCSDFTNG